MERGLGLQERVIERSGELLDRGKGLKDRTKLARPRKVTRELVSLGSGIIGGALAGALFNRLWRTIAGEDEAPGPAALDRNIREVLVVGALQGAVFGLVKAALGRIVARATSSSR